jgi:hypothetical protein
VRVSMPPCVRTSRATSRGLASSNPSFSLCGECSDIGKRQVKYVSTRKARQSPFAPTKRPARVKELHQIRLLTPHSKPVSGRARRVKRLLPMHRKPGRLLRMRSF